MGMQRSTDRRRRRQIIIYLQLISHIVDDDLKLRFSPRLLKGGLGLATQAWLYSLELITSHARAVGGGVYDYHYLKLRMRSAGWTV